MIHLLCPTTGDLYCIKLKYNLSCHFSEMQIDPENYITQQKIIYPECPGPGLFQINDISGVLISELQKSTMIGKRYFSTQGILHNMGRKYGKK